MPVAVQSSRRREDSERSERWVTAAGSELPESGIIFPPRLFSDASAGGRYMRELRARTDRHAGADPCPTGDEWSGLLLRDSRRRREAETMLDTQAAWFPAPQPSSFLQPGVVLSGTQLVSRRNRIREDWNVTVHVEEVDWARGYVAGSMTASQVPQAKAPITTFWEGEIVGCGGHRFHSAQGKWNANAADDVSHWIKFGGFQRLHRMWKQRHVRPPAAAAAAPPPPTGDGYATLAPSIQEEDTADGTMHQTAMVGQDITAIGYRL